MPQGRQLLQASLSWTRVLTPYETFVVLFPYNSGFLTSDPPRCPGRLKALPLPPCPPPSPPPTSFRGYPKNRFEEIPSQPCRKLGYRWFWQALSVPRPALSFFLSSHPTVDYPQPPPPTPIKGTHSANSVSGLFFPGPPLLLQCSPLVGIVPPIFSSLPLLLPPLHRFFFADFGAPFSFSDLCSQLSPPRTCRARSASVFFSVESVLDPVF